ncbi:PLD nuclease N-terminal domain-containing protein [Nonomuraea longicatena]|uniref:Cardiolipin synthase N-terminal domain-containing protein n=1 Tax=Nonomuraea longicatena TaxID=83682 RepID=A0ABP3YZ52_9ACTN
MLYLYQGLGLITLGLWIYCLFDVITCSEESVRSLPKALWVLAVLFFPLVGSVFWLVAGRPRAAPPPPARPRGRAVSPDDDEEFLRRLRERVDEQRRNAPDKPEE